MWKTPTQKTYQPNPTPSNYRGVTPRPIPTFITHPQLAPRFQNYSSRSNGYPRAQTNAGFSNVPQQMVGHGHYSGPSTTRPYRSRNVPHINTGYVRPIGPTTQYATSFDSGSESDTSIEELWSPASGTSMTSSTMANNTNIPIYDEDTDSEDEEEPVLNSAMAGQVRDGVTIFHRDGPHILIQVLINFGTRTYLSAGPTAAVARSIIRRLRRDNEKKARDLENFLRFESIRLFRDYWMLTGEWKTDRAQNMVSPYLTLKGVNLAGLLGSLFRVNILTGDDVHLCLNHVAANVAAFHPLCAIHALIIHCGKKICRQTLLPGTNRFWALLSVTSPQTRQPIWAYDGVTFELLTDIYNTLDRWLATQTLKQIRAACDPIKIAKRKKKLLPEIKS